MKLNDTDLKMLVITKLSNEELKLNSHTIAAEIDKNGGEKQYDKLINKITNNLINKNLLKDIYTDL